MLNSSFPKLKVISTIWAGVLPDELERQADWTPDVALGFEMRHGKPLDVKGTQLHFISMPGTDEVALGIPVRTPSESDKLDLLSISALVADCAEAKARLIMALKELFFRDAESITKIFFIHEITDVRE